MRSSPERIPGAETTGKSTASVGLTPQEGRNIKQFLFLLAGLQPVLGIEPKGRLLLNIRLRARPWSRLRTGSRATTAAAGSSMTSTSSMAPFHH